MSQRRPVVPMAEAMRANATLLDAMARGEIRLRRVSLHGLVKDLRAWAMALEREQVAQLRPLVSDIGRRAE